MIFSYLSVNHELMSNCCWIMFKFTSWMFVCWWGLNWCGFLWSLNEKWEIWGFWWKMNIMMILVKINVMILCLLLFWLSFEEYKLMYKFWGRIWVKGDQNEGFLDKIWVSSEEPKIWVPLLLSNSPSEWQLATTSCSVTATLDFDVPILLGCSQTPLSVPFDMFAYCLAL
jgi:hypothetical protein